MNKYVSIYKKGTSGVSDSALWMSNSVLSIWRIHV